MTARTEDRYGFALEAAGALRRGELAGADLIAVAEELEEMARADARELRSRIVQIMEHMLKLRVTTGVLREYNDRGWQLSVLTQRQEIETLLDESPSLRQQLTPELLAHCYNMARQRVELAYGLKAPQVCPWTAEQILDAGFWPGDKS